MLGCRMTQTLNCDNQTPSDFQREMVQWKGKGIYEILDTGEILTSDAPDAPWGCRLEFQTFKSFVRMCVMPSRLFNALLGDG